MIVLNLEQILEIHAIVISETGGASELRDLGRIESAIAAQTQTVFDKEIYPTIIQKASALARGLIQDHPFVDGNKRTGILAAITFLKINNKVFTAKKGEIEDFAVKVATEHLSVPEIAIWFSNHSR